jgi:hypothetical protein
VKKLKFTCSSCQAMLRVPTHLAGVSAPCPKCGETITAPSDVTLAEEDEPSSVGHEPAIQKDPVHAGTQTKMSSAPAAVGVPVGVSVSNKASMPSAQPSGRVVSSAPAAPVPAEEELEDVVQRPTYGQPIPVPIPPAPTPEEMAAAALDDERAAAEAPPEVHAEQMPVSLDDIAVPDPVVPTSEVLPEVAQPAAPAAEVVPPAPRAIEKTQPIRVNAQPRNLPESRDESAPEGADLPRLDVTLGEQHLSATAAEMLSPDGIVPKEPTKVQLPVLGDASRQDAPDDFIVSGETEAPPAPAAQQEVAPSVQEPVLAVPEVSTEPGAPADPDAIDFSAGQFAPSRSESPESQPEAVSAEPASVSELLGLDGLDPESQRSQTPSAPVAPVEFPEPQMSEPAEVPATPTPLEQAAVNQPASIEAPEQQSAQAQFAGPQEQGVAEPLSQNPIAASTGSHADPVSTQSAAAPHKRSEADVLDDMFGGSESSGNFGLNIKLLIIAGAAVLATVAVFLFGNAMGGWSIPDPAEVDSVNKPITTEKAPAPAEPEKPEVVLTPEIGSEPSIADAPAIVDPVAENSTTEASRVGSTIAMPGDTSTPVKIMDSSGNLRDLVGEATNSIKSVQSAAGLAINDATAQVDSQAQSFDEKVQSIVNGSSSNGDSSGMPVVGGGAPPTLSDSGSGAPGAFTPPPSGDESGASATGNTQGYNPEPSYPAPVGEGSPLGQTHELIDAFLRAPDWQTRLRYTYQGDSLEPAIQIYYQKWEERPINRFSLQLFQMESDVEMGGPYWVYLVSTTDVDQGFPLIVRVENGNLKVDWEIFSEFYDKHFVRFRAGEIPGPSTFRLVIERMSDYYGADRNGFKNLDDYYVYQINPPYGDLNEYSEYAFVKKDSAVAKSLDEVVGLGEEPLAVIITLDKSSFDHGIKHFVITDYVTEGWFR